MSALLWLPGIVKKPLAIDHARDPYIIPAGAVFHIAVSEAASLLGLYQGRNDGIESTGYIRRDGTIEQYRPLNVECDAQLAGNSWISGGKRYGLTSWETQGGEFGEWTDAQVASIKRIITAHHTGYGVPLRVNPGPESSGFGYHRLFKAWNPHGHTCPGPDRVKQFHNTIVSWMSQGAPTTEKDWFDMATKADLHDELAGFLGDTFTVPPDHPAANPKNLEVRFDTAVWLMMRAQASEHAAVRALTRQVSDLAAAVEALGAKS